MTAKRTEKLIERHPGRMSKRTPGIVAKTTKMG
jgi:hypothetical protein